MLDEHIVSGQVIPSSTLRALGTSPHLAYMSTNAASQKALELNPLFDHIAMHLPCRHEPTGFGEVDSAKHLINSLCKSDNTGDSQMLHQMTREDLVHIPLDERRTVIGPFFSHRAVLLGQKVNGKPARWVQAAHELSDVVSFRTTSHHAESLTVFCYPTWPPQVIDRCPR
ncbi:hypothetical protein OsJ_18073 [Oryza sativa Japonica Group]|uniref:Uncharacterized protein n=1 Tax=Oryza sativa subsp. japonica TaxID=39947 RepID=B9FGP6_ORYSJ|nr:hypothetical protein OsJ_18073 [Oryza sativa Japonica Group]